MDPQGFTGGVPVEPETHPIWTNAIDDYTPPASGEYGRATRAGEKSFKDFKATVWRWRDDFQNDFAARMDWTTKSYEEANHPPVPGAGATGHDHRALRRDLRARRPRNRRPGRRQPELLLVPVSRSRFLQRHRQIPGAENLAHVAVTAPKVERRDSSLHPQRHRQGQPALVAVRAGHRDDHPVIRVRMEVIPCDPSPGQRLARAGGRPDEGRPLPAAATPTEPLLY